MAFCGLVDVCLHFHSFRNIDLFHQGLYRVRARLYQDSSAENAATAATLAAQPPGPPTVVSETLGPPLTCVAAYPYAVVPSSVVLADSPVAEISKDVSLRKAPALGGLASADNSLYMGATSPAHLDSETQTFYTQSFHVRYCDEEVLLNDLVQFRLEVNLCTPHALSAPLFLELDLLFYDSNSISSETEIGSDDFMVQPEPEVEKAPTKRLSKGLFRQNTNGEHVSGQVSGSSPDLFTSRVRKDPARMSFKRDTPSSLDSKFISVAYQIFQLNHAASGMREFVSATFDEFRFSLCSLSVHSALLDFRCRLRPAHLTCGFIPRHLVRRPPPAVSYGKYGIDTLVPTAVSTARTTDPRSSFLPPYFSFERFLALGHRGLMEGHHHHTAVQLSVGDASGGPAYAASVRGRAASPAPTLGNPHLARSSNNVHGAAHDVAFPEGNVRPDAVRQEMGPSRITPENMRRSSMLHCEYLKHLLGSLIRLCCSFSTLQHRCLSQEQRVQLADLLKVDAIKLPGGSSLNLRPVSREFDPVCDVSAEKDEWLVVTVRLESALVDGESGVGGSTTGQAATADSTPLTSPPSPETPTTINSPPILKTGLSFETTGRIPKLTTGLSADATIDELAARMIQDFQLLSSQIMQIWQRYVNFLPLINLEVCTLLRYLSEHRSVEYWKRAIFSDTCEIPEKAEDASEALSLLMAPPTGKPVWELHNRRADTLRKSADFQQREPLPVVDLFNSPLPDLHPIVFEQRYIRCAANEPSRVAQMHTHLDSVPTSVKAYPGVHLFVLVHGFQGNSYDLRLIKNTISLSFPGAICLTSNANEDNTEDSIEIMGQRLADEIVRYVEHWCGEDAVSRLSFICHSLGGVIARAALPKLKHLWSRLYTFVSFSSPHLGYMCNTNRLIDAGLWVLKKWRKALSLQQLTLSDAKTAQQCFLYKLCTEESEAFSFFRQVCFVSSFQDQYVPFESARVELPAAVAAKTKDYSGNK